ncbi:PHP domain-containing protein [Clostridium magnum]|uniref:Phosphatase YcdX n=1 Tax=Clostridium magnum DSM 2767 TaxID=1121326 RepID=A0A161YIY3_9CLOT|nr:PHP domain-containing protein [Clostridium magnum]KZL90352.1 phosphatase YcdX [Clostridium magnum DSM 2767]SHH82819.1 PHP domain-containing protein [Clostridium magnum DSM 2767]
MNYLYDYHIHTTYSIDGKNTILEVCKSAVEKGLKEIAITDHFEPKNRSGIESTSFVFRLKPISS